jgi:hypothetical protein
MRDKNRARSWVIFMGYYVMLNGGTVVYGHVGCVEAFGPTLGGLEVGPVFGFCGCKVCLLLVGVA